MIIKTILLAVLFIGIAFAGIAIKMFFKKGYEFRKSCGSIDPATGNKIGCTCGSDGESKGTCRKGVA